MRFGPRPLDLDVVFYGGLRGSLFEENERGGDDGVSLTPVVVYEEDSLGTVLQVLVESRLHHVYVVDEARQPQGVITLTDVIRFLVQALPTPPRA